MVKLTIKILEDALARVLLCAATVVDNDYGKLRNRKQDLKILSNLQKIPRTYRQFHYGNAGNQRKTTT